MTDNKKVPYLQCLYHTGTKVYKYWLAALAVIGVLIGLYFVVASAWKQIVDFYTTVGTALGYVGSIIVSLVGNAWSLACAVPWYWWVAAGVTIGPLILVAIWCALKHYNVDIITILHGGVVLLSLSTLINICRFVCVFVIFYPSYIPSLGDGFCALLSLLWWLFLIIFIFDYIYNTRSR